MKIAYDVPVPHRVQGKPHAAAFWDFYNIMGTIALQDWSLMILKKRKNVLSHYVCFYQETRYLMYL